MGNAWVPNTIDLGPSTLYGASLTNTPVSREFRITAGGARQMVVAVKVSGVTVGAGITAKLQTTADGSTYVDSKTAAITTAGLVYIKLLAEAAGDQTYLPLLGKGRIVLTTGAGSAVTVDGIYLLQED